MLVTRVSPFHTMLSTQSDNFIPICPFFDIISVFAAELEEPKIGIVFKRLSLFLPVSNLSGPYVFSF